MEGKADSALCSEVTPSGCYSYCTPKVEVTVLREGWKVRRTFSAVSLWIREKQRSLTDRLLESLKAWSHGILASLYWDARLQLFPVILSQSGCGFGSELVTALRVLEIQLIFELLSGCFPREEENKLCHVRSTTDSPLFTHSRLQSNVKEKKRLFFSQRKNDAHSFCSFGNIVERNVSILWTEYILYAIYNV